MQQSSFYKEQSNTLKNFLDSYIYPQVANKGTFFGLELIITPDCNKNCKYCYLQKHKEETYPLETRNPQTILKNMKILFNYFLSIDLEISKLDLYSGEIWESTFSENIFTTILDYIDKGLKIRAIMIPSNGAFTQNDKAVEKIEYFIEEFSKRNVALHFSLSYDGILDLENRPYNNGELNNINYYDEEKLFNFADRHNYGFHPMVSAYGIEKWVENHKYWKEKMNKLNRKLAKAVMFLEVRDGDTWTDEAIVKYLEWLQVYSKDIIDEEFGENYYNALEHILRIHQDDNNFGYIPFFQHLDHSETSCSLTQQLVIRLGDLAIVPCHRLCYDKFIYGQYIVENDSIVDVQGKNVNFMFSNLLLGGSGSLKCDTCPFNRYCIKQCRGACFEHHKETLFPIEDVCNLQIAKILFQLNLIMDISKKIPEEDYSPRMKLSIRNVKNFLDDIQKRKEYDKWISMVETYRIKF